MIKKTFMYGFALFLASVIMMLAEIPVGISLFFAGSAGIITIAGVKSWFNAIGYFTQPILLNNAYIVIPMFLLMGQIASKSNISSNLVNASQKVFGKMKSGVGIACIFTSAIFGAICGSSIATISSLGNIFYQTMKRNGYSNELIFGIIAVGGTLGILIPPSIVLVVYAIAAQESIGKLFTASIPPSIIAVIGYMITTYILCIKNVYPKINFEDNNFALEINQNKEIESHIDPDRSLENIPEDKPKNILYKTMMGYGAILCFLSILIAMYRDLISPAECASSISAIMILYKISIDKLDNNRWIDLKSWLSIFDETAKSTGMIIFIFLGASIFNTALSLTSFPAHLSEFILSYSYQPLLIILILVIVFLLLGCIMDGLAMVLLFAPLLYPIITKLDILPREFIGIWFGVLMLSLVEIGMITPPVGINLFVIKQTIKQLSNVNVTNSVKYFLISDLIRIGILVFYPQIVLVFLK